jgi:hypothetical protein
VPLSSVLKMEAADFSEMYVTTQRSHSNKTVIWGHLNEHLKCHGKEPLGSVKGWAEWVSIALTLKTPCCIGAPFESPPGYRVVIPSLQSNTGVVPQIRERPPPSKSFLIHYSLLILLFYAICMSYWGCR